MRLVGTCDFCPFLSPFSVGSINVSSSSDLTPLPIPTFFEDDDLTYDDNENGSFTFTASFINTKCRIPVRQIPRTIIFEQCRLHFPSLFSPPHHHQHPHSINQHPPQFSRPSISASHFRPPPNSPPSMPAASSDPEPLMISSHHNSLKPRLQRLLLFRMTTFWTRPFS